MKPNLSFTFERRIEQQGRDPIRLAVTMQAWTDREVAEDLNDSQIQAALTKAGQQIGADLFGQAEVITPTTESCQNCRFYRSGWKEDEEDKELGYCQRHPPRGERQWPTVQEDDWCGDYQRCIPTAEERS